MRAQGPHEFDKCHLPTVFLPAEPSNIGKTLFSKISLIPWVSVYVPAKLLNVHVTQIFLRPTFSPGNIQLKCVRPRDRISGMVIGWKRPCLNSS